MPQTGRTRADAARTSRALSDGGLRPAGRAHPRHHVERRHLGGRDARPLPRAHGDRARPAGPRRVGQAARRLLARRLRERRARPARGARARPRHDRRPLARRRRGDAVRLPVPRAHRAARARLVAAGWGARSTSCCAPPRCRAPSSCCRSSCRPGSERAVSGAGWVGARLGLHARPDLGEVVRGFLSLNDAEARAAFLHTLRAVIDPGGQRVSGHDRLYLAGSLPTLIVWGERDPIIPAVHGRAAHEAMPGSQLELFAASGHFPHMDDAVRFVDVLTRVPRDDRARRARSGLAPRCASSRAHRSRPDGIMRRVERISARNCAGYDAPIGLTADPVVFTLVGDRLSRAARPPAGGAAARPVRASRRVRRDGGVARADRRAQAAREDRGGVRAPGAAADVRGSAARPARLAAVDRLPRARPARGAAGRAARGARGVAGTRSTTCPSWRSTTRRSSTTGSGGCGRG